MATKQPEPKAPMAKSAAKGTKLDTSKNTNKKPVKGDKM